MKSEKFICIVVFKYTDILSGCMMATVPAVKVEKKCPVNISDTVNGNYKIMNELGRADSASFTKLKPKQTTKNTQWKYVY